MRIKVIYGDYQSEWICFTTKRHKVLIKNPPDRVVIRIGDFYENSPDKNQLEIISFSLFCCLAREFNLHKAAQAKSDNRHLHMDELDEWDIIQDVEQDVIHHENKYLIHCAFNNMTEKQRKRIELFMKGMTLKEIADLEHLSYSTVRDSIQYGLKKIKEIFE